jgi:nucleotide-binding universal stress UspA family protein
MYKRIVLAYDGSECGQKALLDSHDIAQWSQAQMFLVAVMPNPTAAYVGLDSGAFVGVLEDEERQKYREILDDGLRRLAERGHAAQGELLIGDSVREVTNYANKVNADLIVVGHKHLESRAARWWRASSSPSLIEHASCSVLVVITK